MIQLFISRFVWAGLMACMLALTPFPTWAGPGAHGPNGEHLDSPKTDNLMQAGLRIEANSDLFELVATLTNGELSIFIDRFVTNEPLLHGQVEVESGSLKAQAKFRAEIGDYLIDDPALLDAMLRVPATLAVDDYHFRWEWWVLGALVSLVLLAIATARLRKQRQRRFSKGGLA